MDTRRVGKSMALYIPLEDCKFFYESFCSGKAGTLTSLIFNKLLSGFSRECQLFAFQCCISSVTFVIILLGVLFGISIGLAEAGNNFNSWQKHLKIEKCVNAVPNVWQS